MENIESTKENSNNTGRVECGATTSTWPGGIVEEYYEVNS